MTWNELAEVVEKERKDGRGDDDVQIFNCAVEDYVEYTMETDKDGHYFMIEIPVDKEEEDDGEG